MYQIQCQNNYKRRDNTHIRTYGHHESNYWLCEVCDHRLLMLPNQSIRYHKTHSTSKNHNTSIMFYFCSFCGEQYLGLHKYDGFGKNVGSYLSYRINFENEEPDDEVVTRYIEPTLYYDVKDNCLYQTNTNIRDKCDIPNDSISITPEEIIFNENYRHTPWKGSI